MRRFRAINAIVLALALLSLGGGQSLLTPQAHADPITDAQGFSLNPTYGPAAGGNDVTITPPFKTTIKFKQIFVGEVHTIALDAEGNAWAWGQNAYGNLGNGTTTNNVYSYSALPSRVLTPPGVQFKTISVGGMSNLAIGNDGNTYAWGENSSGQLGVGSTDNLNTPVLVTTPSNVKFIAVSAGRTHSLAIGNDGNTYAWGNNTYGQLGDGTTTNHYVPAKVDTGIRFTTISTGYFFSLALDQYGKAYAWGSNSGYTRTVGVLGVGDTTSPRILRPTPVAGTSTHFKTVSASTFQYNFSVGISKDDGNTYAWGENDHGQLGDGTTSNRNSPVRVLAPVPFTDIKAGGWHVLALGTDHQVYAWGWNSDFYQPSSGLIGDGSIIDRHTPVKVSQPTGVAANYQITSIGAGATSSASIGSDGSAYGWGPNKWGNIGDGTNTTRLSPVRIANPKIVITGISFDTTNVSGYTHDTTTDLWHVKAPAHPAGTVKVRIKWTLNGTAQTDALLDYKYRTSYIVHFNLGGAPGTTPADQTVYSDDPQPIKWPDPMPTWEHHWFDGWFDANGSPWDFSKPVTAEMTLTAKWETYQFSINPTGGSTNGHSKAVVTAPDPPKGIRYTQVSTGWFHSVAIGSDGNTYAWGQNSVGQLGNEDSANASQSQPVRVHAPAGVHFLSISAGYWHTLAIGSDGKAYAWGFNGGGRLGVGDTANKTKPTPLNTDNLPAGARFTCVSGGGWHSSAIDSNGTAYAWGANDYYQVGVNDTIDRLIPTPVATSTIPTGTRFTQVSAGYRYTLVLDTTGKIYGWGSNDNGQLGTGNLADGRTPVASKIDHLPAGTTFAQISAGGYHSLAIDTTGKAYSWGNNHEGELSQPGTVTVTNITAINSSNITPGTRINQVQAGAYYSMFLDSNGRAYSCGYNDYGQLGSNDLTQRSLATAINTDNITVNTRIIQITGNYYHSLAINNQYTTYAWGNNADGEIGNGTTTQQLKATPVGLQRLTVTGVKFDNIAAPTGPTLANGTSNKWNVTTPPHPTGDVDTTITWTLGGYPQDNYILTYTYWFDLPAAGAIPLQRYSGATFIALTAITAVSLAGHQLSQARKRKAGRHSPRPNQSNSRN
ncbi:hypothetical protein KIM372_17020 [Bombiscardovia nodaiensis]|uniref:RCC1-like domain-containing protein n=1 Tax=Bombiscardovia nodaiensis TaxID=2932181 RepID=A0ABN6SGT5_9BIFI|nr:hypothetical protein KIM372_17020 [Bombiscardovia nodaiensis]